MLTTTKRSPRKAALDPEPDAPPLVDSPWMTVDQTAAYVGISTSYMRQLVAANRAPAQVRIGRSIRMHRADTDDWMRTMQHCDPETP